MPLLRRSWFHRMWVVQEIWPGQTLAPIYDIKENCIENDQEVTLFCGGVRISWLSFIYCATVLYIGDTMKSWYSGAMGLLIASAIDPKYYNYNYGQNIPIIVLI